MGLRTTEQKSSVISTTNATQTTLLTFTLPGNCGAYLEARIVARDSLGAVYTLKVAALVKRLAAGAVKVGNTATLVAALADTTMTACAVLIDVSGSDVRVRVTGIASRTIEWYGDIGLLIN